MHKSVSAYTMTNHCIFVVTICLFCGCIPPMQSLKSVEGTSDLTCNGRMKIKNVTLTAYYPSDDEQGDSTEYSDARGNALATLQDFLDDNVDHVTVSMDDELKIPYGTRICIPQLNAHYRRRIDFQIRDTASNVKGRGIKRVDICVRSEADSYDDAVNLKQATVVY